MASTASSSTVVSTWRRLWALSSFAYSLRVFIALASIMGACWLRGALALIMPLFLGCIACALAESDDHWRGRLRALLATLLAFAVAAFAIEAVFHHPWLYLATLAGAAFGLTMLGAIGSRYQAIAYGTLIVCIYTSISVDQEALGSAVPFWLHPALLLAGAAWYGLLSVVWCVLFPNQPVQQFLATLYDELGRYLRLKSQMFEPVRGIDMEGRRLVLAKANSRVVAALNTAKDSLFNRMTRGVRPARRINRYLTLYFIAQDIHERASSSHYSYEQLTDTFFHSDVMFRCQRVLNLQGHACHALAQAIRVRQPYVKSEASALALGDLQAALSALRGMPGTATQPLWRLLLRSLVALARNLSTLEEQLAHASTPNTAPLGNSASGTPNAATQAGAAAHLPADQRIHDRSPQSLRDAFDRVRLQFTPSSALFRHAVRLSLALAAGYGVMHLIHANQGFWILLTTVFVCRQGYGATRSRVAERIVGTIAGLLVGWALFRMFPNPLVQAFFAVAAGVTFFATRTSRYALSTGAITLMVLLCFNQIGNGYALILPRVVDTLLGAFIAVLAVYLVLPDWQTRRINQVAAAAVAACGRYLREIMQQYQSDQSGKQDTLGYRVARREAHNADAALSNAVAALLQEPGRSREECETAIRLQVQLHTLLNYLSGLGAHRHSLPATPAGAQPEPDKVPAATRDIAGLLDDIAQHLKVPLPTAAPARPGTAVAEALDQQPDDMADDQRLVQSQLALIARQIEPLRALANQLAPASPS
ncbi:MAG: YccS family putative transporter [Comamonas sp.]